MFRSSKLIAYTILLILAVLAPTSLGQRGGTTTVHDYDELARELTIIGKSVDQPLRLADLKSLNQMLARSVVNGERILDTSENSRRTSVQRRKDEEERGPKLAPFVDYPRGMPVTAAIQIDDIQQNGSTFTITAHIDSQSKKKEERARARAKSGGSSSTVVDDPKHRLTIFSKDPDTAKWKSGQTKLIYGAILKSDWQNTDSSRSSQDYLTFRFQLLHIPRSEVSTSTTKPVEAESADNAPAGSDTSPKSRASGIPSIDEPSAPTSQPTTGPTEPNAVPEQQVDGPEKHFEALLGRWRAANDWQLELTWDGKNFTLVEAWKKSRKKSSDWKIIGESLAFRWEDDVFVVASDSEGSMNISQYHRIAGKVFDAGAALPRRADAQAVARKL